MKLLGKGSKAGIKVKRRGTSTGKGRKKWKKKKSKGDGPGTARGCCCITRVSNTSLWRHLHCMSVHCPRCWHPPATRENGQDEGTVFNAYTSAICICVPVEAPLSALVKLLTTWCHQEHMLGLGTVWTWDQSA